MLREGEEIPADPHVTFDPIGVHLYADSWRVDFYGGRTMKPVNQKAWFLVRPCWCSWRSRRSSR